MVASPEVCRMNGAKSSGPVSDRGKAIASSNSQKHGVLSTKPPLLATEDLETFQGIMQGLIDEYQPGSPTEHLLVQQIGMCWLRLHRLWGTEAAIANAAILKAQWRARYPDFVDRSLDAKEDSERRLVGLAAHPKPWKQALAAEKAAFELLIEDLQHDLTCCPKHTVRVSKYKEWIQQIDESLYRVRQASIATRNQSLEHLEQGFWLLWDEANGLIYDSDGDYRNPLPEVETLKSMVARLVDYAAQEVSRLQEELADYDGHIQAIAQAEVQSKGLQTPELFSRYERHLNNLLNESLNRLVAMQQRKNEGSMGSFGQNLDKE